MKTLKTVLFSTLLTISTLSIAEFKQPEANVDLLDIIAVIDNHQQNAFSFKNETFKHIKSDVNGIAVLEIDFFLGEIKTQTYKNNMTTETIHFFDPIKSVANVYGINDFNLSVGKIDLSENINKADACESAVNTMNATSAALVEAIRNEAPTETQNALRDALSRAMADVAFECRLK